MMRVKNNIQSIILNLFLSVWAFLSFVFKIVMTWAGRCWRIPLIPAHGKKAKAGGSL